MTSSAPGSGASLDDGLMRFFRTFFDTIDDGACLFEQMPLRPDGLRDYRYLSMNPAMQAMFGIPDLTGQSMRDNFPDEVEAWYDDYERVLDTGQPARFERESAPQGMVIEMYVARLPAPSGNRLLAVMRDVTARRRAEEALLASEERLRSVLNGMGECFGLLDRDLRIVTRNDAAMRLDGRPLSAIQGLTHAEAFPEGDPEFERLFRKALSEDVPVSLEERYQLLDGSVKWIAMHAYPVPEGLAVFWRDITERQQAEMALQKSQERQTYLLKLSDALRPLADPAAVQEVAARLLGEHLRASRVFYGEFVFIEGVEHIVVEREYRVEGVPSFIRSHPVTPFNPIRSALSAGRVMVISDTEANDTDESLREIYRGVCTRAIVGAPLIKDGRLAGGLGVHSREPRQWSDLEIELVQETAERTWAAVGRARAEETARLRSAQLEQQTQQLRRLASELTLAEHNTREVISKTLHDHLQQLLFSAKLRLVSGEQRFQDDERVRGAREALQEAIEAARSLSVDLFPPVLRSEGLPDALDWLAAWARKKFGVTVVIEADLQADPEDLDTRILLFESVRELIFNAIKHGQVDRVGVELSLQPDDRVQIVVVDEGPGFEVRHAIDGAGAAAGLGLFSIRQRMALMGGDMTVKSAPGEGSSFNLVAPRR